MCRLQLKKLFWRVLAGWFCLTTGGQGHAAAASSAIFSENVSPWNFQQATMAMGVLAGATTLWILLLRRKVQEQTSTLKQSETKFRSLVEQSLVGVYVIQSSGLVYVNPRMAEIFGYTVEEMQRIKPLDLVSAEDRELVREQLRRRIEGEIETVHYYFKGLCKDGSVIYLEVLGNRTDYNGKPSVLGMVMDITERKKVEAALAEAGALTDALLDNSPDHIYFKDRDSRFVRYSKSFAELLKLPDADALKGKTDFDFFSEEHARPAFEDEQRIIQTGEPIVGKLEKETYNDGHVTWALTTKLPWRDKNGSIVGTFGISKDVTRIKEAERKLAHEREFFHALLENLPDAIYFKDKDFRFVRLSVSKAERSRKILLSRYRTAHPEAAETEIPAYLANSEQCHNYLLGKTDFDVYSAERAGDSNRDEVEIMRTGKPLIGKLERVANYDGTHFWSLTTKMAWRDESGNIIGTFGVSRDVSDIKEAEARLEAAHQQLVETSRRAGMAEVATDVLHNVGNVLNSVNVSCSLTIDRAKSSKVASLAKTALLLEENESRLGEFFSSDPRGQQIPAYLKALAEHFAQEQKLILEELEQLIKHVEHIKQVVAMQQSYAKVAGVVETINPCQLVEDALHINAAALSRHEVSVLREFQQVPSIQTEKHKVLQILVNLIRNAKYALDEAGPNRLMTLKVCQNGGNHVKIQVMDNGVGIPPENLTRIFGHGFTTRPDGHGFGLHSSALSIKELGGSLEAHSEGLGKGAIFTLLLPQRPPLTTQNP